MTSGPGIAVEWITAVAADVPADDSWLHPAEAAVLAGLHVAKRRDDWRLGRWAAKQVVLTWLGEPLTAAHDVAVLAAPDGAPEVHHRGEVGTVALSISHRAGRAVAAVAAAPSAVGCDLEIVEPRSAAFVRQWLTHEEQAAVEAMTPADRPCWVNLLWTAKEAAAKVLREGLRIDTRDLAVNLAGRSGRLPQPGQWHAVAVDVRERAAGIAGWCRAGTHWVLTVAADPAPAVPRRSQSAPPA